MRTGIVAKKLGMSHCFLNDAHIPVTLLKVDNCVVVGSRTKEQDGYSAVRLGYGTKRASNINKPTRGILKKAGIESVFGISEFRVSEDAILEAGKEISAEHFVAGQLVDVTGVSVGKGFAGGMKRHNFGGLEATHGVSISHRSHGSTGQCQDPGKVFKGKKMAGQMGNKKVTVQNLEVISVDAEDGIIAVLGGIPGSKGSFIEIKDSVKKAVPANVPYPAKYVGGNAASSADADNEVNNEA